MVNSSLRARLPKRDDDDGSLIFALLLIFLATALAGLMTPVLIVAMNGTRSDQRREASIAAAEAGIDVAMGQIRAANDGTGATNNYTIGVLSKLPCATLTGSVSGGGNSRYQVTISYYVSDPRGQSADWLTANAIQCVANAGARSSPAFALLTSLGTDQATGAFDTLQTRTVQATYVFQSTNANIVGGLIHVYKTSTSTDLCIDAGSGSPAAGTIVTMQRCASGLAQQTWAYNSYLNLVLVSSQTPALPLGLCLDAGTPEVSNLVVKVQACTQQTIYQQQWSFNDSANFSGTSDGQTLNAYCFNVRSPNVVGSQIILSTNCNTSYDNTQNWSPSAAVGAGAAGASSGQLVNFNQFGRCLDVTNQDPNSSFLIDWPCKQAPNPTNVLWNQRWSLPTSNPNTSLGITGVGKITTNYQNGGTLYCLRSPLSSDAGQYVVITQCPSNGTPNNMKWTVFGGTSAYSSSYQIQDATSSTNPLCLQPTDPSATPPDLFTSGNNVSKLIVQPCNGSTLQKWNAPANLLSPTPLVNVGEK